MPKKRQNEQKSGQKHQKPFALHWHCRLFTQTYKPSVLMRAARPPIRKATAPPATIKAVNVTAALPSDLRGLPVASSTSGTQPWVKRKFRRDSAAFNVDRTVFRRSPNTLRRTSSSTFASSSSSSTLLDKIIIDACCGWWLLHVVDFSESTWLRIILRGDC